MSACARQCWHDHQCLQMCWYGCRASSIKAQTLQVTLVLQAAQVAQSLRIDIFAALLCSEIIMIH